MTLKRNKQSLLGGIRILDFSDEKAAYCTKLLADLGARVIKVEKPGGDPARDKGPMREKSPGATDSLSFCYHHTNKLGITLNLESREGKQIFLKLTQKADVVVESFPAGYLQKLGLGFNVLGQANPAIIVASVTGFGQKGPHKKYKSCDLVAAAFGGQMSVTGSSSREPLKLYGEQSYLTASLFAAIGILLAVRQRNKSGKGEHIDIALQESVVASLEHVALLFFSDQVISKRQGSLHWNNFFYVFPCKDGFIQMTLFENWETLVEWMDGDGMAQDLRDEKYRDAAYRQNNVSHIIDVLSNWTKGHTTRHLFKLGQLMRFPWAPVQSPEDIIACPQLKARKFFTEIEHPEEKGTIKYPRLPYKFSPPLSMPHRRAPRIGEDNIQIYHKELGFSKNELKVLSAKGII
jgi:crotonobetainyl-CoA:carnitine CoA-transferase CaiB-like acyl-CoA transferase